MKKKLVKVAFVAGLTLTQTMPVAAQEPEEVIIQNDQLDQSSEETVLENNQLDEETNEDKVAETQEEQTTDSDISLFSDEEFVYPTSISLLTSVRTFMVQGDTATIKVNGYSGNPTSTDFNSYVTWSSSDENVAKVDSQGNITAVGAGNVTITATVNGKNDDMEAPASDSINFYVKGIADGYQYVLNGDSITLDKYIGEESNVVVPSTIQGLPVTTIGKYCFAFATHRENIVSVTLPEGITTIDTYAFNAVKSLTSVNIPSTVRTIGKRAFYGTSISSIAIPEGVTSLGNEAFYYCSNLTSVSLPQSLTTINAHAFNKTGLKQILLPDNITYLGTKALNGIETVYATHGSKTARTLQVNGITASEFVYPTSISLLSTVRTFMVQGDTATIKVNGYSGNPTSTDFNSYVTWSSSDENVAKVDSQGNITAMGAGNVAITATVNGKNADMEAPASDSISFYVKGIADGYQYTLNDGTIALEKYIGEDSNVVVPSTIKGLPVTTIGKWSFAFATNSDNITSVTLPEGITLIDDYAFNAVSKLETVNIPSTVKTIGQRAFYGTAITNIVVPEGVTSIGKEVFNRCTKLTDVSLPQSLKYINANAFNGSGVKEIILPDNISYLGTNALKGIETIYAKPGTTTYETLVKAGYTVTDYVIYPTSISITTDSKNVVGKNKEIVQGQSAQFYVNSYSANSTNHDVTFSTSNPEIATVDDQGNVTILGEGNVDIIATCIGKNADMEQPASASVTLTCIGLEGDYQYKTKEDGTILIDEYVGSDENVVIPSTINGKPVTEISNAFYANKTITSVVIPEGVTTLDKEAFGVCSNLKEVSLPSTLKTIGERAFAYTNIESIVIPEGVTSIGRNAFNGCRQLKTVTLPSTLKTINPLAFSTTGIEEIILPDNISYLGTNALKGIETIYAKPGTTTYTTLINAGYDVKDYVIYPTSISITTDSKNVVGKNKEIVQGQSAQFYVNSYSANSTNHDVTFSTSNPAIATVDDQGNVTILGEGSVDIIATCIGKNADMDEAASTKVTLTCIGLEGDYQYKTKEDGTILIDEYVGSDENVVIPSTINGKQVTEISNAFYANKTITSVVIPEGVTTLDKEAFGVCSNLKEVTLPSTLKTIGERAFAYTNIESIVIPKGVTSIGRNAFNGCRQLKKVTLPSTLKTINPLAFSTTGIEEIILPDNISYIGTNALKGISTIIVNPNTKTEETLKNLGISYSYPLFILNQAPTIECDDLTLNVDDSLNPFDGLKAMDAEDGDLTDQVEIISSNVDTSKEGEYEIVYRVEDSQGASCTKTRKASIVAKKVDTDKNTESDKKTETDKKTQTTKKKKVNTGYISNESGLISLFLSSLAGLSLLGKNKKRK
ncbi:leucine-rich repeat protein [Floccifex sp.]|uniref:leucine-rich repeat protein n=1 Tax=Floccifex sp. TaxID=2815810 RepID=UPI002A7604DF|nr:leucine-rich repeat protein [Floccifex sp.]MDY2957931.1 leucine-rich repeat protein [Floccifex sp.]